MQPDIQIRLGDRLLLVEVKQGLTAARNLRAGLLDLAYELQQRPHDSAVLLLEEPEFTLHRLKDEWEKAAGAIAAHITNRLALAVKQKGEFVVFGNLPMPPDRLERETTRSLAATKGNRLPQPDYELEILKVLATHFFAATGPVPIKRLGDEVGCTYPTTAKTLEKFRKWIARSRQRGVELQRISAELWSTIVRGSDDRRPRFEFVDRSGRPRPPSTLVRKLQHLNRPDLAIGGSIGARIFKPDLDLVGNPRLDLCLHCPGPRIDLDFVAGLDAGLSPATPNDAVPQVVVHVLRRREAMFVPGADGSWHADPVECLLDLHEARLEQQAAELFSHLTASARKAA